MSWIDHQVPGQICHTSPICWSVLNQAPNRRRLLPVPGDGSGSGFLSWGTPSLGSQVFRCAHGTHGMGMKLDKASSLQVLTILDPTWSNKQILINKKGCVSKPNGNSWSLKQPWNISMCVSIPQSPAPAILGWPKKRIRTGDVPPSLIHRYAKPQRFATATTSKIPWGGNNCCHGAFEDEIFTQWKVLQWCKSGFFLTTFHSLIHLSLLDSQAIFYQDLPAIYSCKCSKMITLASWQETPAGNVEASWLTTF